MNCRVRINVRCIVFGKEGVWGLVGRGLNLGRNESFAVSEMKNPHLGNADFISVKVLINVQT